jgi:ribosomal protein S18 acetylase RimI-like enzyme
VATSTCSPAPLRQPVDFELSIAALTRLHGDNMPGVFASPALAARIDRAEGRLCAAIAREFQHARVIEVGGGVAVFAERDSPSNKLIGAGFSGPIDETVLEGVEAHFTAEHARLQAEVSTLADPALHRLLAGRGYLPSGFENVLGHALREPAEPASREVIVEQLAVSDLPTLADVMAEGFSNPDVGGVGGDAIPPAEEMRRLFSLTMRAPGFRGYIARIGGAIVGGAALRLDEGVAQFSGAATLPAFRRRGVQTALLRTRLADAARAGCDTGVVVTQPASKSQQNAQREGFSLLYARQLLVKAALG